MQPLLTRSPVSTRPSAPIEHELGVKLRDGRPKTEHRRPGQESAGGWIAMGASIEQGPVNDFDGQSLFRGKVGETGLASWLSLVARVLVTRSARTARDVSHDSKS